MQCCSHILCFLLLTSVLLSQVRLAALRTMLRAYKPSPLPVAFLSRALNFCAFLSDDDENQNIEEKEREETADAAAFLSGPEAQAAHEASKLEAKAEAECRTWLKACGLVLVPGDSSNTAGASGSFVDTKAAGNVTLDLESLAEYEGITAKELN